MKINLCLVGSILLFAYTVTGLVFLLACFFKPVGNNGGSGKEYMIKVYNGDNEGIVFMCSGMILEKNSLKLLDEKGELAMVLHPDMYDKVVIEKDMLK